MHKLFQLIEFISVLSDLMLSKEYLPLLLLLFITSVPHVVTTTVYYVVPDSNFPLNNYTNTLQHYVIKLTEDNCLSLIQM